MTRYPIDVFSSGAAVELGVLVACEGRVFDLWLTFSAVTAVGLLIFQYQWMSDEKRLQEPS